MKQLDFTSFWGDACLFRHQPTGCVIVIYVDDVLAIHILLRVVNTIKDVLTSKFKLGDMGDISYYLGCRIIRDRQQRKLWMVQDAFLRKVVDKFGIGKSHPISTPLRSDAASRLVLAEDGYTASANLKSAYQRLIEIIMWSALHSP